MHSMTGFGQGKHAMNGREITVELKSVNHRFLDINQKIPKYLSFLESEFRDAISNRLDRGHIEIFICYQNFRDDAKKVEVDYFLLGQYMDAVKEIQSKFKIADEISFDNIMKMQGVFTVSEQDDDQKEICSLARIAIDKALDDLISMRKIEGCNLLKDVSSRINNVKEMFAQIAQIAPNVPIAYKDKLKSRMTEMLKGVEYSEDRLLTEVAIFADKCNIDEEIARFYSHIMQFEQSIELDDPVGRKLDFTLQEINREINTIGSKANCADMSSVVMNIKAELEKIREQVQNIE